MSRSLLGKHDPVLLLTVLDDSLTNQLIVSKFTDWTTCGLDNLRTSQFGHCELKNSQLQPLPISDFPSHFGWTFPRINQSTNHPVCELVSPRIESQWVCSLANCRTAVLVSPVQTYSLTGSSRAQFVELDLRLQIRFWQYIIIPLKQFHQVRSSNRFSLDQITLLHSIISVADPKILKRGAENNLSAPSSFIANEHNKIYMLFTWKKRLFKKIRANRGRLPPPHPLNLPLYYFTVFFTIFVG